MLSRLGTKIISPRSCTNLNVKAHPIFVIEGLPLDVRAVVVSLLRILARPRTKTDQTTCAIRRPR